MFREPWCRACAAGELSADATDFDVVSDPNKWLVLMEYFLEPAKLKAYMQANCMDKLEPFGYGQINAGSFYVKTNLTELDADTKLKLCVDKNRAWEDHHLCAACHVLVAL